MSELKPHSSQLRCTTSEVRRQMALCSLYKHCKDGWISQETSRVAGLWDNGASKNLG